MLKMFRVFVDALELVMCVLFGLGILSIVSQPLTAMSLLGLVSMVVIGIIFMLDVGKDIGNALGNAAAK